MREVETGLSTWEWTRLLLKMHFRSLSRSFLSWVRVQLLLVMQIWEFLSSVFLQDFIVNLAGMEFGAGGHPGLQVWRMIKVLAIKLLE